MLAGEAVLLLVSQLLRVWELMEQVTGTNVGDMQQVHVLKYTILHVHFICR